MLKYKQTTITINGAKTKGYSVEGLNVNVFRGLQVTVVKDSDRWTAHETTTGLSITPPSWAGGYSNKTRNGILQIVSNFLSNVSEPGWTRIQEQLDYTLEANDTALSLCTVQPASTERYPKASRY